MTLQRLPALSTPLPQTLEQWHIVPAHSPLVLRNCPRCKRQQRFASSEAFRVNGHHKRLDVWLIYLCVDCEATWNLPVHSRTHVEEITPTLLQAYQDNDKDQAWHVGFDRVLLRQAGVVSIQQPDVSIHRERRPLPKEQARAQVERHIQLHLQWPLSLRLDQVLAKGLGWTRQRVQTAIKERQLWTEDTSPKVFRRPATEGQRVYLSEGLCFESCLPLPKKIESQRAEGPLSGCSVCPLYVVRKEAKENEG